MPSFKIKTDKSLKEHKKLHLTARAKITKFVHELRAMEREWKNILDGNFVRKVKCAEEKINCDSYDDVRKNWAKIEAYLTELRATREDLPWPECLPSGIQSCTLCTEYVDAWKEEYGH
jgi:hypothetical protein